MATGGLLAHVQSKTGENRTKLEMGNVVQQDSRIVAGIMNADGTEGELDIKIGNAKATGSKGIVGYANGVDLKGIFAYICNASSSYSILLPSLS